MAFTRYGLALMKAVVDALEKKYALDVHNNDTIYIKKPKIGVPAKEQGSKGRYPAKLHMDIEGISVERYMKTLKKSDCKKVRIRKMTKGWLNADIHIADVWIRDEQNLDKQVKRQSLIIRIPIHKKDRIKFSLSNIMIEEQTAEEFAFMQAQRFWVERTSMDNSHGIGISELSG